MDQFRFISVENVEPKLNHRIKRFPLQIGSICRLLVLCLYTHNYEQYMYLDLQRMHAVLMLIHTHKRHPLQLRPQHVNRLYMCVCSYKIEGILVEPIFNRNPLKREFTFNQN